MNLYLIGYRGCGKSSVAPLVAARLGWEVVDSDLVLQSNADLTIAEIFRKQGESAFRSLEQETIAKLARENEQVISLGGGAPMFEANRKVMVATGKVVYLSAPAEVLWARISGDRTTTASQRPDLTEQGGLGEVRSVLSARSSVYEACADCTIETDNLTIEVVAEQIFDWWQTVDKDL